MAKYIIEGGKSLSGEVKISGAKNATLGILAAAIMTDEDITIENVPSVWDVEVMLDAIKILGAEVTRINQNTIKINSKNVNVTELSGSNLGKMRATYYFVGALLARFHKARVIFPGGCNIGARPINLHLKGFKSLGANAYEEDGHIIAKCERLIGANIYLDVVSVGATINIMLASVLSQGQTTIENAAKEPHVVDIANFLNSMGASIKGAGTDVIRIKGVKKLHGTSYSVIPDQIEAGTYMALASITKGDITIKNIIPKHLESISAKLIDIGNQVIAYDEALRVIGSETIYPTTVKTMPYPGFPTDMQPQFAVTLSIANGKSRINESIFENRFKYVDQINEMGASIKVDGSSIIIDGVDHLNGHKLVAPDLRAGAAFVLAALSANGQSTIEKIEYVERGYEDFVNKLKSLGANIRKVED